MQNQLEALSKAYSIAEKAGMNLLKKSHVSSYTRSDGTVVQEHEDSRQKHEDFHDAASAFGKNLHTIKQKKELLTPEWTIQGDQEIARRAQAREEAERNAQEEFERQHQEHLQELAAAQETSKAKNETPVTAENVKPGTVIRDVYTGERHTVTEIADNGDIYARHEDDDPSWSGGYIGGRPHEIYVVEATKEPWQQTKEEYGNDEDHGGHVYRALQQGKPVPPEVKAQYPELSYLTRDSKIHLRKSLAGAYTLRKAHVAAYDRITKTGAMSHIAAHKDSRVRRYEIKIGRTNNSAELHKLRMERFAHLPHWGSLDDHTKQAILDAEDEKHADHKLFERLVERRKNPHKTDTPGTDKIDRSGWGQSRLFKARRTLAGLFLICKSQMQLFDTHHVAYTRINEQGTVSNIKAKGSPRPSYNFAPRGNVGGNIDTNSPMYVNADTKRTWGIGEEELKSMIHAIVSEVPDYTFKINVHVRPNTITFSMRGTENNGNGKLFIDREIDRAENGAYHGSFEATKPGNGIARAVNRGCMHLYQRLGLSQITVLANCDVGGYCWGKFGFVLDRNKLASTDRFKRRIGDRLSDCAKGSTTQKTETREHSFRQFTEKEVQHINRLLANDDPKAIWQLSDCKGDDGLEIGKALLLNLSWHGKIDMKDRASMDRFAAYVNPKPEKVKVMQLSLF